MKITIHGELVLTLKSKQDWEKRIPYELPELDNRDKLIWVDKKGFGLTIGLDFVKAESAATFPVKVYRQIRASEIY